MLIHALRFLTPVTICTVLACGPSAPAGPTAEEKKAAEEKAAKEAADAAAIAERKAKREAEEKAKEEADKKVAEALESVCVLPEKLPKDPVAACDAVGKAHDAFIHRVGTPEAVAEWDGGGKDKVIPMSVVQCTQADSIKAAACQAHALENAGPELADQAKTILQTCIDKFPGKRRGGAPVLKKRPG